MTQLLDVIPEPLFAALLGVVTGVVLGLAARYGRFCTLGAIEDALYGNDYRRIKSWGIAIAVAITFVHIAALFEVFDPFLSMHLSNAWVPLGSILGGLIFGYGMALAGNCGYGMLARLGGGDIRSLVMLVMMGLAAYAVISGPLAQLRVFLLQQDVPANAPQSYAHVIGQYLNIPAAYVGVGFGLVGILILTRALWHDRRHLIWGSIVGLCVALGWIGTYWIAENGFRAMPVQSHSFAAPVGDVLLYLMLGSGLELSFGVGSVVGVAIGAFAGAGFVGELRWEACEDHRELRRQIFGAGLMGIGAVLALGCSIGQGLSAFALLSFGAPVTLLAIFIGAWLGLRQLIEGHSFGGFARAKGE